jgi:hypothetical protein
LEERMHIHEITQIYGTGPFGHAGATKVFVGPTIKGWLDLAATGTRGYEPEGIIHDLFVMIGGVHVDWRSVAE